MICRKCNKETDTLVTYKFKAETCLLCPECVDYYEAQADLNNDIRKEEE